MKNNDSIVHSDDKYLTNCFQFLSMLFLTIMLGTYVLAYKMISCGGYIISGGIFIFPINYGITDIITEVYGYDETKKMIKLTLICCLLFALVIPFIAILPSPENWSYQSSYTHVLGNVFRFFLANTIGIVIGISINGYLIEKWKVVMQGRHFLIRSILSSATGELITSIIADIIAFVGTTDILGLIKLMFGIFTVKFIYSILLSLPNTIIVMHLKLKSGLNLPNNKSKINPFGDMNDPRGELDAINMRNSYN